MPLGETAPSFVVVETLGGRLIPFRERTEGCKAPVNRGDHPPIPWFFSGFTLKHLSPGCLQRGWMRCREPQSRLVWLTQPTVSGPVESLGQGHGLSTHLSLFIRGHFICM